MRRPPLPGLIMELFAEPVARNGLLAGSAALFAAALDPKVWGPALPTVQAAIRDRPQIEALVMLVALAGAGLLIVGGVIGDSARARPIIVGGLVVELGASLVSLVLPVGPAFVASRLVGGAAAAFVVPTSLALVAMSYQGVARATAIGIAYGAYGAAAGAAPVLLQLIPGVWAPAFLAAMAACAGALWLVRERIPDLPRPSQPERAYVVGTAVWAFGIVAVTVGLAWIGGGLDNPLRWGIVLIGVAILGLALVLDRRRRRRSTGAVHIARRPVAVAVFVGVVLGVSQTAPMLQLPLYFQLVQRFGPVLAVAALAPLFVALLLAGPIAGFLLARFAPRWLVGAGLVAVGLGDLLIALVATPSVGYIAFVLPCLLVGAGFVIATTVRTAVIFASMSRGLPATAAALNEASISVGNRIGIVVVTAIVAEAALAAFAGSVAGLPATESRQAVDAFKDVLVAIGTPSFSQIAGTISAADVGPYLEAYTTGVRLALALSGSVALVSGVVAWVVLGRGDPLATVYEHREEREVATASIGGPAGSPPASPR